MARTVWFIALWSWMVAGTVMAARNQAEVTLVYPCRPAAGPITIDGQLDPAEWEGAVEVSGFQISGSPALAPEQVTMRLLYDQQYLYVGVKCYESNMKNLKTTITQTDGEFWVDDAIEFFLDVKHDHEHYYQFAATAKAVRYDNQNGDSTWNSNWKAAAQRDDDSWTVEAAVPFADLQLPAPPAGTTWGFNLCREREAGGRLELYNWADVQRVFQNPPRFGHLYFVDSNWQPTETTIVAAARDADGKEAHVFVNEGYWRVTDNHTVEHLTYRDLLRGRDRGVTPLLNELRSIYQKNPRMSLHEEFGRLEDSYAKTRSLVADTRAINAETWAQAKSFLDGLQEKVDTLYWRVRLAALNETM